MNRLFRMILVTSLIVLVGACATTQEDDMVAEREPRPDDVTRVDLIDDDGALEALPMDDDFRRQLDSAERDLLAKRLVHFAFDSSTVTGDYLEVVQAHAAYLRHHRDQRIVLEGHTDERGSREYNVGLGERRAQAVRRLMLAQGVNSRQIETVSFGEERPAVRASNEEAWARNRRVELIYGE